MEAQKIFDDDNYYNSDYAKVAGVTADELLLLEFHFLEILDFTVYFKQEKFEEYRKNFITLLDRQRK